MFPIFLETISERVKLPIWLSALLLNIVLYLAFVLSDAVSGVSLPNHSSIAFFSIFISLYAAIVGIVLLRDKTIEKLQEISSIIPVAKLKAQIKAIFDEKNYVFFGAIISTLGISNHVIQSFVLWGRLWWYSIVDIILIGFLWWFIAGILLWFCIRISFFLCQLGKRTDVNLSLMRYDRMCGFGPIGKLTLILATIWGVVLAFGTVTTLAAIDPMMLFLYLILDFLIIVGSMSVVFLLPLVGFHNRIHHFKKEKLSGLLSEEEYYLASVEKQRVSTKELLYNLYIMSLISEVEKIKEWPIEVSDGGRFILSCFFAIVPLIMRALGIGS